MKFQPEDIASILGGTIAHADLEKFEPEEVRALKGDGQRMVLRANLHTLGDVTKATKPKTADEESRTVEHTASSFDKDRLGDRIDPRGWDLRAFRANSQLLWGHRDHQPPIGRVLRAVKTAGEGGELATLSRFHEPEKYDFADLIFRMVLDGDLPAVSVGFMPILIERPKSEEEATKLGVGRWGVIYRKQELLELSVVTVPALSTALAKSITKWEQSGKVQASTLRMLERYLSGDEPRRSVHRLGLPMCEVVDENVDPDLAAISAGARALDARIVMGALEAGHLQLADAQGNIVERDAVGDLETIEITPRTLGVAIMGDGTGTALPDAGATPRVGRESGDGEIRSVDFDELRELVRAEVRDGFDAAVRNIQDNDSPHGDNSGSDGEQPALEPSSSPGAGSRSVDPALDAWNQVLEIATRNANEPRA